MNGTERAYWALEGRELAASLGTSPEGLAAREAVSRLKRAGPNTLAEDAAANAWGLFVRQLANPLVLILVFGAFVSMVLREWIDASIILSIVLGSALLGFWQEYRASAALAKLRQRLALSVQVRRDGSWVTVPVATIVPGDLVRLTAGNLVPADAIVLEARDFLVSEAALTGESFPVEKWPGPVPATAVPAQRTNSIHLGSSVRSGTATAMVVATGARTMLGRIAGRLAGAEPETEFSRGLRQFGYLLTRLMIATALFVILINILNRREPVDSLLFAVALAVGLSPELLPAIVSVTLSAGARRMAGRGVIVRRLEAIENLGSMDVLCTDKTGTLTTGEVELSTTWSVAGEPSDEVLRLAVCNAYLETGISNPLDAAIVSAGRRAGIELGAVRKLDEIPYDFQRKRLTIVVAEEAAREGEATLITKGAVANVLACCSSFDRGGAAMPLDKEIVAAVDRLVQSKASQGYRVLAVARRTLPLRSRYDRHDERDLTLVGFLLLRDPLKEGIALTVRNLARLGIATKIISGDNRYAAAHVGSAIGLDATRIITGEELARMKEEALWHLAETTDIFAEVDPQQKERIVRALQKRGHAVGYLGDGINDAPALHAADVGISVDQAVDVARESADVVLLRPDLDVLKIGVLDGRRTFANTLKYIKITVSANFGNMISMAVATLLLSFLPLTAKQILLNNFLSDFPSLAIATDQVDREALESAQRWNIADVRSFMMVFGLISTGFDLLTFYILRSMFRADEVLFQSAWFVVSLLTELVVILILRTRLPAWISPPSPILLVSAIAVAALAIALPFLGELSHLFGLFPLPLSVLAAMLVIVVGYAMATEFAKRVYYRTRR